MIFGFGRKKKEVADTYDEERELVTFQGALNGNEVNLTDNARLVQAGLVRTKELVSDALARRADTIRIEPKGERCMVSLLIDGMPYQGPRLPKRDGQAVTQMLKLLSGLDVKIRAKPQAGGLKAQFDDQPYELLVDSSPMDAGRERLMVRARNLKAQLNSPEDLGFSDALKAKIREMSSTKRGVMLVCGGPRTGTTTALYAVLRGIDPYLLAVYTLAEPQNREMVNVPFFETNQGESLDTRLERCIRSEADVILVDPIRDAEFAKAIFAFHDRVAFLSEIRAKDAAHGIVQVSRWLGDPVLASQGLRGLFSQKLIRTLCEACKEAYRPNPKMLAKTGLPEETKVLYRPAKPSADDRDHEPCQKCGGVGFFGRAGMIEWIEMTDAMRQLVAKGADVAAIKKLQRQEGMQTLQQDGLRLAAEGKTSLDELQRVFKAS